MGRVQIAVQNIIDLTDDLDLSRSQLYKITPLGNISVPAGQIVTKF